MNPENKDVRERWTNREKEVKEWGGVEGGGKRPQVHIWLTPSIP